MQRLLNKITSHLIGIYDPDKIILFGSAVKGGFRPDSDIDLLVIGKFSEPVSLRGQETAGLWHSFPVKLDILYFTPAEVEQYCNLPNSFISSALKSGEIIYEKK